MTESYATECVSEDEVVALVQGALAPRDRTRVQVHAEGCDACRALVTALARMPTVRRGVSSGAAGAETTVGDERAGGEPTPLPVRDPARYVRGSEIARGGMGRIMSAHDRELGRQVALKELLSPDRAAEQRFEREVRITARLQHPSIIAVQEAGRWPTGEPFYAMQHLEGRALDRAIADASPAERIALLRHAARRAGVRGRRADCPNFGRTAHPRRPGDRNAELHVAPAGGGRAGRRARRRLRSRCDSLSCT